MEVEDDRIFKLLMDFQKQFTDIQKQLSELKGEINGFNKLAEKIDTADNRSREAKSVAYDALDKQEELKKDFVLHKKNQVDRQKELIKEKQSTRRWMAGIVLTVLLALIADVIMIFQ